MIVIQNILAPLEKQFSTTKLGRLRAQWFSHVLLACIVPFTSSISSNLLRALVHLFGVDVDRRRFYTFIASSKLPWDKLWSALWHVIPEPTTDGRLIMALDDFINPKVGKKIFACSRVHDHAAKANQTKYPWAQCVTSVGLLKRIKGRWACMPLAHRFYLPKKIIDKQSESLQFKTKLEQSVEMICAIAASFSGMPILAVCDSWFGNNGLLAPARKELGDCFQILSRLRANIALFDKPGARTPGQRGRNRKYGARLGSTKEVAAACRDQATTLSVFLYGKTREVTAYSTVVLVQSLRCPVRVVFVYRRNSFVALFSTDLTLSDQQIIEFYGARWKIESGFKEIKRDIGASQSQMRNKQSVENHLNFCMMATTVTWLYADRFEHTPERRHMIRGRSSFAFSDIRHIIAKVVLSNDFQALCPKQAKPTKNIAVDTLLRMVA